MSKLLGTSVADPIVPFTSDDKYPTHYAEYGKGGFRTVKYVADLSKIPEPRLEEGMLVYVIEDRHAYQWIEVDETTHKFEWIKSKIGGGIEKVQNLENVPEDYLEDGNIVYSIDDSSYFYYLDGKWIYWGDQEIYIGANPPTNKKALWIDTTNHSYPERSEVFYSIQNAVKALQEQVNILMRLRTDGVISGDINEGTRTELMERANPEKPKESYEVEAQAFYDNYIIDDGTFIQLDTEYFTEILEIVSSANDLLNIFTQLNSYLLLLKTEEGGLEKATRIFGAIKGIHEGPEEGRVEGILENNELQSYIDQFAPGFSRTVLSCSVDTDEILEPALILAENYTELAWDPNTEEIEPESVPDATVRHISIKMGTWDQLQGNIRNFVPGEIMWCTNRGKLYIYVNGSLVAISGSGGSGESGENDDDDMNELQVKGLITTALQNVDSIGFIPVNATVNDGVPSIRYIARVNEEGKLIVYDESLNNRQSSPGGYFYKGSVSGSGLLINSYYLGGLDKDECSHNFVELSNVLKDEATGKGIDVNLNGLYLCYIGSNNEWKVLKLWGVIPADGTFLVRGAQCSVMDVNTTKIKVNTYDMNWNDPATGKPIKFDQTGSMFYLCWANEITLNDGTTYPVFSHVDGSSSSDNVPPPAGSSGSAHINLIDRNNGVVANGYIDLTGYVLGGENKPYPKVGSNAAAWAAFASKVMFRRWYPLDPVTQSNPKDGIAKHNTVKYLTALFLEKEGNKDDHIDIKEFTPKASFEYKTIANTRTLFAEDHPSTLTCTFGIQATDNSNNPTSGSSNPYELPPRGIGATRCFCWNSVGYYNEYLEYRIKNSGNWIQLDSLTDNPQYIYTGNSVDEKYADLDPDPAPGTTSYLKYYTRVRWESAYGQAITTHRVILRGLTYGTYEYRVTRENDPTYVSDIREFTVRRDSDVRSFNFVQTTDQQGANWEEYEVWNLSARIIKREHDKYVANPETGTVPDFDFTINTGDICYNGSRSNEWIDYFEGYKPLGDKEEMLTVGNNDLAPIEMREIGTGLESPWKINTYVGDYFYTYEIDPLNPQIFIGRSSTDDTKQSSPFKIPSLYSFNYGKFHFISLLSENRTISSKTKYTNGVASETTLVDSTVNRMYGMKDELRTKVVGSITRVVNTAAKIYDLEEEWIIKDLLKWKNGGTLPINRTPNTPGKNYWTEVVKEYVSGSSDFDLSWAHREEERFCPELKDNCRNCIVFTHEMPFNIISNSSYKNYENNTGASIPPRETAKAYLNRYHNYEFQRLFKQFGISMVMGGHKHTCAITQPVYDAPLGYNPISDNRTELFNDGDTGEFNHEASFIPFIQVTENGLDAFFADSQKRRRDLCKEIYNNSSTNSAVLRKIYNDPSKPLLGAGESHTISSLSAKPRYRLEVVDKITTPSYVMCQATGFKNKSNSDLSANDQETTDDTGETVPPYGPIPWERFYVPGCNIKGQSYPFYTVYQIKEENNNGTIKTTISAKMYKIKNMYAEPGADGSKAGYWDLAQKIYNINKTLEENRTAVINNCQVELYNTFTSGSIVIDGTDIEV